AEISGPAYAPKRRFEGMHDVAARPDLIAALAAPGADSDRVDLRVLAVAGPQRRGLVAGPGRLDQHLGEEDTALDRRRGRVGGAALGPRHDDGLLRVGAPAQRHRGEAHDRAVPGGVRIERTSDRIAGLEEPL